MNRLHAKRTHLAGLKKYASKGLAADLKSKYGPPEPHPEPDADDMGGPSDGDADNAPPGSEHPDLDGISTEELMAILHERMKKEKHAGMGAEPDAAQSPV